MIPITTDKQRLAASLAVMQHLADEPALSERFPTGTTFTPVGLDVERGLIEVVVERPADAERTLAHIPARDLLAVAREGLVPAALSQPRRDGR
ncbi:MAG: hypothetical protein ACLPYS_19070 [Vulcanimicrobiaceae bacterium]